MEHKTIYSDEYRQIIRNLIKARHNAGLTQSEVALRLNRPRSYVGKIEGYSQRLDIIELKRFCDLYNVNLLEIIRPILGSNGQ